MGINIKIPVVIKIMNNRFIFAFYSLNDPNNNCQQPDYKKSISIYDFSIFGRFPYPPTSRKRSIFEIPIEQPPRGFRQSIAPAYPDTAQSIPVEIFS